MYLVGTLHVVEVHLKLQTRLELYKKALPLAVHNRHKFQPGSERAAERSSASKSLSQRRWHVCLIKKINFYSYASSGFIIIHGNSGLIYYQVTPCCKFCWFWGKGVRDI